MARIVTCKCALEFYDSKGHDLCNRCRKAASETERKMKRLKAEYRAIRYNPNRVLGTTWDVIQLRWRHGLTHDQIAEILEITIDAVRFEMDIARQNAR